MGTRPEEVERQGTASMLKKSATLMYKHYRLFLALVLAYYLPISIFAVYVTLSFSPSSTPLLGTSVNKDPVNTAQTTNPFDDAYSYSYPIIQDWTILALSCVLRASSECALSDAKSAVTACHNTRTPTSTDDDRSVVLKDVEIPLHLLLFEFISHCYVVLAFLFLSFLSVIIGGILQVIILATTGWSDPKLFFDYGLFPVLTCVIVLSILVALVQVIVLQVYWRKKTTEEWSRETPEEKC